MLCLTRNRNEAIIVRFGEEVVRFVISEIRGDKVRVAVDAAKHIQVNREEIDEAIQRERSHSQCTNQEKPLNGNASEPLLSGIVKIDPATA